MAVKDSTRQENVYSDVLTFDQSFVGTLGKKTVSAYNPITEVETATMVNHDAACVFIKASKNEAIPDNFVISDTQNFRIVLVAAKGQVPNKGDLLTLLSETYSILGSIESSGGDDALFRVYAKKGLNG